MKYKLSRLVALSVSVLVAAPTFAQHPAQPSAQIIDAAGKVASTSVSATIVAIDIKNRVVTLRASQGDEFAVEVGGNVNLTALHIGDSVETTYVRAVALDFQKGDGIRMDAKTVAVDGSAGVKSTTVVTNILAVDATRGTVTVLGPYGHLSEVHLRDPAQLDGVKVGDQMKVTYTRAVATSIVKKTA